MRSFVVATLLMASSLCRHWRNKKEMLSLLQRQPIKSLRRQPIKSPEQLLLKRSRAPRKLEIRKPTANRRKLLTNVRLVATGMDGNGQHHNTSRDGREPGSDWRMRDRETSGDRETDSRPFKERRDREQDQAHQNWTNRDYYFDVEAPRRRVKICLEYANGDEYCQYRR